jgi:hypothetical protein
MVVFKEEGQRGFAPPVTTGAADRAYERGSGVSV